MIPSLQDLKDQLAETIKQAIIIDSESFENLGVEVGDITIEVTDYAHHIFHLELLVKKLDEKLIGFSPVFVMKNKAGGVVEGVDTYMDLKGIKSLKARHVLDMYAPSDLHDVEVIELIATEPLFV